MPVKDQHCALARAGLEPTAQPELHCKGPQSEVIRAIFVFTLQPESEVIRATMLEGSPHSMRGLRWTHWRRSERLARQRVDRHLTRQKAEARAD